MKNNLDSIKTIVKSDLEELESSIENFLNSDNPLSAELKKILMAPAKRLRPLLGFLFLRCCFANLNQKQKNILLSVELIHNATLIHDDIIDESKTRRNQETLNAKFDENLAVIAGDYLLSVAMEKILSTNSLNILKEFVNALKQTCTGEINQYFSKFSIPTLEDYIEKSKEKTALLFKVGITCGILAKEEALDENLLKIAETFGENFGIAFQIRDDLLNIINSGNDKDSGVYTAPIIFAIQENQNILNEDNLYEAIKKTKSLEKTVTLMDNYFTRALDAISELENNKFKQGIEDLIKTLKVEI